MNLLENVKEKYENIILEKELLYQALHNALKIVDENSKIFINTFPRPNSINNIYPGILNGGEWDDWTSGFWTGILWLAYEITKDEKYFKIANYQLKSYTERIKNKIAVDHHDLGFLYIPSVVANYKITKNEEAKNTAILAANQLKSRYREKGKFIQAWGILDKEEDYRLIIDCNLNVPLLFFAYEITKDEKYLNVAKNHLETVSNVIVRENGSTYHTYFFNLDGSPKKGATAQGKSDDSTWARGQAWGIYGFALAYKYLKDEKYLTLYKKVTNVFLNKLPKNDICYWDLDFNDSDNEFRDSSSSAIAICGILEMDKYLSEKDEEKKVYVNAAKAMMKSLILEYSTKDIPNSNGLLKEAVYSIPHGSGVNECCIWGDYFYMEALIRFLKENWNMYW